MESTVQSAILRTLALRQELCIRVLEDIPVNSRAGESAQRLYVRAVEMTEQLAK